MRRLLPALALLLFVPTAHAYQYWNDIRHSALLPGDQVLVRMENPTSGGEENYILYGGAGIEELEMIPVLDGPSTLEATVPGPTAETRRYGFRLLLVLPDGELQVRVTAPLNRSLKQAWMNIDLPGYPEEWTPVADGQPVPFVVTEWGLRVPLMDLAPGEAAVIALRRIS